MYQILHVSVSGYYNHRRNLGKPDKDAILSAAMQKIPGESPYNDNYGVPRMQISFLQKGLKAGIRRITRIIRAKVWLHKPHRKPRGLTHATTEILSLIMRDNMKKELCMDTFKSLTQRYHLEGCILHNHRGSQYTSEIFRTVLMEAGVQQSLNGVDHCYDNPRMERMKRDTVKSLIFRYVFTYYNQKRVYTANTGGYPPAVYRLLQEALLAA